MYAQISVPGRPLGGGSSALVVNLGAYVGPGDVLVSAALSWWGLRSYTAASVGTKPVVRLRRDSDNTEHDFSTVVGGGVDVANVIAFQGSANLFVTKLYDQVGTNHFVQATASAQLSFILGGPNNHPMMSSPGTGQFMQSTLSGTVAQPLSVAAVYKDNGAGGGYVMGDHLTPFSELATNDTGLGTLWYCGGGGLHAPYSFNVWYTYMGTVTATAGVLYQNGASIASGNVGSGGFSTDFRFMGFDAATNQIVGTIVEAGLWSVQVSSTDASSLSKNQRAYWGI